MQQHPSQIFRRLPQPWCAICNARHFVDFDADCSHQLFKTANSVCLGWHRFHYRSRFSWLYDPTGRHECHSHQSWRQTAQTHSSDATVAGEEQWTHANTFDSLRGSTLLNVACSGLEGPPIFVQNGSAIPLQVCSMLSWQKMPLRKAKTAQPRGGCESCEGCEGCEVSSSQVALDRTWLHCTVGRWGSHSQRD